MWCPGCSQHWYGTSAWASAGGRGRDWLLLAQAPDGGFGANAGVPPSIEETRAGFEQMAVLFGQPEGLQNATVDAGGVPAAADK